MQAKTIILLFRIREMLVSSHTLNVPFFPIIKKSVYVNLLKDFCKELLQLVHKTRNTFFLHFPQCVSFPVLSTKSIFFSGGYFWNLIGNHTCLNKPITNNQCTGDINIQHKLSDSNCVNYMRILKMPNPQTSELHPWFLTVTTKH